MSLTVELKKLHPDAKIPAYQTAGSAAMDLCALLDQPMTIQPRDLVMVPTGIAIGLPNENWVALVHARSGLAIKHGIALSNGVGVIDSDYRGELKVGMTNLSNEPYTINSGERIAQIMFQPVTQATLSVVETLSETTRGSGGFGSTGR